MHKKAPTMKRTALNLIGIGFSDIIVFKLDGTKNFPLFSRNYTVQITVQEQEVIRWAISIQIPAKPIF